MTAAVSKAATLIGCAVLPADTFTPGPTSGQFIEARNNRQPPFIDQQPVQGFSALIKDDNDSYIVLSDNGFGARNNSSDYILSIYHIDPDFRTAKGGSGNIQVSNVIRLSDPQRYLPYPAARDKDDLLTGADLDPESFRRAKDGSYWIGEEFNPSLLHFSVEGVLLAPPFKIAGLNSVGNPSGEKANLPRSRGFEGMAISADGKRLYPMLEGPVEGAGSALNIYTFNIEEQIFVNNNAYEPSFRYRLDEAASAIGDFTMYSNTAGLVLERDSEEGNKALLKKVYQVVFNKLDEDGYLLKTLVADLLKLNDPHDLNQDGDVLFSFPFWTIEGLVVLNATTLGIVNDNNYPLGQARNSNGTQPDDNEFILIKVDPLWD
ncbi:MAG: esterase-like activity of phytase family protein [Xanthomonadales bacterium]|nr:esterase-like activity of phytase family protein [Xanthomonadales bacterium]